MSEINVIEKVEQIIEYTGAYSGCKISYTSFPNDTNNSTPKRLCVSGGQFDNDVIMKIESGFEINFCGDWEEKDLINFFVQVAYQRGILKKPETKKKVTRKRQPKKLIPEMKQENV